MLAALCLAAGGLQVSLPVSQFTLRWTHSIEKVEWAEDYEVAGAWLHLSRARIRGSGAGMEPPPGSWLLHGVWHYRLDDPWRREIVLARNGSGGFELVFQLDNEAALSGDPAQTETEPESAIAQGHPSIPDYVKVEEIAP